MVGMGSTWEKRMAKNTTITLTGNTFPHRDRIKEVGGHWDGERKAWVIENSGTGADRRRVDSLVFDLRKRGVNVEER
jgi:hypothetical protein